jgi:chromate transporter
VSEQSSADPSNIAPPSKGSLAPLEVGWVALKLGLTSFGGPIAHLGYFRDEYVLKRRWLDEETYADLIALCQFLPGPASSQVGIGVGTMRAGLLGGVAAWLGFTLPSAIALTLFAYSVDRFDVAGSGWVHGLKVVAVAIVAQAVWGMGRQFCTDRVRATIAILAALAVLAVPNAFAQPVVILLAGLLGWWLFRGEPLPALGRHREIRLGRRIGIACWALFFGLLIGLPLLRAIHPGGALDLFTRFYRVGSLVFGGGHLVLPLLQAQVVPPGWLTNDQFLAGYGAAQAVPGPLFTFSAYLGAIRAPEPNGAAGAAVALVAIFLPSFLLIWGALPFWDSLRRQPVFRGALQGINACVVGILLAALYTPVWTSSILSRADFGLALACAGLLMIWKLPPWAVVLFAAVGGELLARVT